MTNKTELVAAIKTPVVIDGNFEEVKAHFAQELQKYDIVVTLETLPEAKKLATELNKAATEVKSRGKAAIDEASEPINAVKEQVKELAQMLLDGREKLTEQIKRFEDEMRKAAAAELNRYKAEQVKAKGILDEFSIFSVDDLANLQTLTSTGKLAAKAKASVDERLAQALGIQQQTENRLLRLENESLKAGIAPLERRHVELFLFEPDEVYQMRLQSLFEAERQREQFANEQRRKQEELAKQRQQEAEDRARKAEADRIEAQRLQAEQQARYEAERAQREAEHAKQLEAAKAQSLQQQPEQEPVPQADPLSGGELHAIGDIRTPKQSQKHVCTFADACAIASTVDAPKVAIWTKASGAKPVAVLVKDESLIMQVISL